MRKQGMAWLVAAATGLPMVAAAQQANAPVTSAAKGSDIIAGMDLLVAADGTVASVNPAAALPEPLRQQLVKRVSQWRYEVPMWEGQPASVTHHLILRLLAMPTTTGGFAIRIAGVGSEWHAGSEYVPKTPVYPQAAMRQNIGGVFSYALQLRPDGSVEGVRRLYPETLSDGIRKSIDVAAKAALLGSRYRPVVVNGVAIACEVALPIVFSAPDQPSDTKPRMPESARDALRSPCPTLVLSTHIENTML